jgi:hypothetical protein
MKKPKHYNCEVYGEDFYFFIGWTHQQFEAYLKKQYQLREDTSGYSGLTMEIHSGNKAAILVWTLKRDAAVVAHECLHAVNRCFKARGMVADFGNDEPQAYLLTCLMREAASGN